MGALSDAARLARYAWRMAVKPNEITLGGFRLKIPAGAQGKVLASLYAELYERHEASAVARYLEPDDVVVEAGAAIGYVGLHCARIVGAHNVHMIEANDALIEEIKGNFASNGHSEPRLHHALAGHRDGDPARFHVAKQFWSSSTKDRGATERTIHVPTVDLNRIFREMTATVFICDIEGGEFDLIPNLDFEGVRLAMIEIHPHLHDGDGVALIDSAMTSAGFERHDMIAGEVGVYVR